jgi:hypothetical protein
MPQLTITLDDDQLRLLQQEAQRRQLTVERLVPELLSRQLQLLPAPPRTWQETMQGLLPLLSSHDPETRQRAREQVMAFGQSMIPELETLIFTASQSTLTEVATLLSSSGSPAAIRPLLQAYAQADAVHKVALYHEVRVLLGRYIVLPEAAWTAIHQCTPRTAPLVARQVKEFLGLYIDLRDTLSATQALAPADVLSLVALLRWKNTGSTAQRIAYALTSTALSAPTVELRQALPLLRVGWQNLFAPAEFLQATKAIERATDAWADLPLPAASQELVDEHNLPVPVEEPHAK